MKFGPSIIFELWTRDLTDVPASIYARKMDAFLTNAPIWRIGNRRVKLVLQVENDAYEQKFQNFNSISQIVKK